MTPLPKACTLTCSRVKPRLTNSRTSFSPKLSVGRMRTDGSRGIVHRLLLLLLPLIAAPTVMVRNGKQYYPNRQDISDYKVTGLTASSSNVLLKQLHCFTYQHRSTTTSSIKHSNKNSMCLSYPT
jgi:hypothetical protein